MGLGGWMAAVMIPEALEKALRRVGLCLVGVVEVVVVAGGGGVLPPEVVETVRGMVVVVVVVVAPDIWASGISIPPTTSATIRKREAAKTIIEEWY